MYKKMSCIKATIMFFLIMLLIFINSVHAEASRRKIDIQQEIEKSNLMHWTTVIHDKMFDVYVDRNAQMIIVRGEVDTQDEKEKVEEYLKAKSPSNYKLFSSIQIND